MSGSEADVVAARTPAAPVETLQDHSVLLNLLVAGIQRPMAAGNAAQLAPNP